MRSPRFKPPAVSSANRRGFALLITITLLAFLVLLLVSLATLTRVETQVAGNSRQLGEARQNALMALTIAIGQLQKYAGPDQRVTTTADLVATKDKTGAATPAPLFSTTPQLDIQPGARYWTAAWGDTATNLRYDLSPDLIPPTNATGPGNRRGVTPGLLNWLVSGNETATFAPNGTTGGVTPGAGILHAPGDPLDLVVTPGDTATAVVLVGANSVGSGVNAPQDYVAAPLVSITAPSGAMPGISGSPPIGRYAWWIGDEGVKARLNLQNGYQKTGLASDQINSFVTAQRSAVEFMDRDSAGTTTIGSDFDFTNPRVPGIITRPQLALISTSPTVQSHLTGASQTRFHDLTTQSCGVLSDTYAGGLKKDLTADIADTSSDTSYRPADSTCIFTPLSTSETYLPTWGHLRTWARTHPDATGAITPHPATATDAGIGPVLAYAGLGYDVRVLSDRRVILAVFPIIALYNPYTVAIAPARYDVGFRFSANSRLAIQTAPAKDPLVWTHVGEIDWGALELRPTNDTGVKSNDIYFTVDGMTIPPGESHLYYLSTTDTSYTPGALLTRAPAGQTANPLNYCYLPSSLTLDSSVIIQDPDPSNPTSYLLRILLAAGSNSIGISSSWGSGPRAVVTLAEEGGLNNPDAWYQRSDILMDTSGMSKQQLIKYDETITAASFTLATAAPLFRISSVDNWYGPTQGPRNAFRFCSNLEGGGDYQATVRTGLPQISKIWLRHGDIRAPYGELTTVESNAPRGQSHYGSMLFGVVISNDNIPGRNVARFPSPNQYALSMNSSPDAGSNPTRYTTLFDILPSPKSLVSLGQLQHVPFARYSFYSAYPFGNSMAELRIPRNTQYLTGVVPRPGTGIYDPTYDLSWHLNRAIWDKYFLSTAPASLTQADINAGVPLPDARLTYYLHGGSPPKIDTVRYLASDKLAYDQAAANLLNAGAFNINSTSEQAWRAILSGTSGIPQNNDYAAPGDNVGTIIPFPRFSGSLQRTPTAGDLYQTLTVTMSLDTGSSGTNFRKTLYHGNRGLYLSDTQAGTNDSPANLIKELARTIVVQVRTRGPFLSLSDFVNRSLTPNTAAAGIKGALQSAIDNMETSQANPYARWDTLTNGIPKTGYFYGDISAYAYPGWDVEHYLGCTTDVVDNHPELSASRFTYAFSPKYLTQADVLSTIGPGLSARSDTFTIRTYGEKINPATQVIEARAWCEAVVQRTPDFINPANPPQTPLTDSSLTADNQTFGRKFIVVSFRWLDPSEI